MLIKREQGPVHSPGDAEQTAGHNASTGGGEAEDYRDEPRTQWCFRAESSRTSPAHSIPSPTVTAGTQFSPFKHIICARMAVKHHTLRSFTHLVPWYCCVCCFLSIIEPLKDLDGELFLSIWYLDQQQGNLRTIEFLAHLETGHFVHLR